MRLIPARLRALFPEPPELLPERPLLARALAWTFSVWIVHALLRLVVLVRPDAFGLPFVGKPEWYLFHAWCFDARWIAWSSLPFVLHVAFWERRARWWAHVGHAAFGVFHGLLLVATVADHEMQRFMGAHLTPTLLDTYGNTASLAPLLTFLADDRGGRYLPLVLLFGAPLAAFWIAVGLRRLPWFSDRPRWGRFALAAGLFVAAGWIFTEIAWSGRNRARKLAPVVAVWWESWREGREADLPQDEFRQLVAGYRAAWLAEAGSDTAWNFPDPALPYWKVPRGGESVAPPESAWNVVLVVLESHRALNAGFLKPWGAARDATPFLDSVAPHAEVWTDFHVTALPTVRALTSIHLGVPNHPDRNIVTDYPGLRNRAFSALLGERGWTTRFFSAADPAWDNQTPWLRQWYQGWDYDRFRETDGRMFAHAAAWMRANLEVGKPFLVTLMTKSNHYPFNLPPDADEPSPGDDLQERMAATMRYTERHLRAFVDSLRAQPWYSRTVFVVTADHGFPLGEHGCSNMGCGLFDESTRVPLVIWGSHPALRAGRTHTGIASQVDLAPTLLALAGVRAANHFVGTDLLRADSATAPRSRSANHYQELLVRTDSVAVHGTIDSQARREWGNQAFHRLSDPRQERDLWKTDSVRFEEALDRARRENTLLEAVLRRDALAPQALPTH